MATLVQKHPAHRLSTFQLSTHCCTPGSTSLVPIPAKRSSTRSQHVPHHQQRLQLVRRSKETSFSAQDSGVKRTPLATQKCVARSSSRTATGLGSTSITSGTELNDLEDFESLADSDGLLSIVGFGSLLSIRSAKYTFPDLQNFRVARLDGFRRAFAHVAPVFLVRGIANLETREMSSLSVEPCDGESILVTMFEIDVSEVPAFIEREHEFRFLTVYPKTINQATPLRPAVVCSRYSDEEYRRVRCKGSEEEYEHRYGRFGIQRIWVDDVLPCRTYLRHCVLAAQGLSPEAYASFLDHTFLADRRTTIRQHLEADPEIMLELPPPELTERYGG